MRRIDEKKPESVWDRKVHVEMSVKELALIRAVLGPLSYTDEERLFDNMIGENSYEKVSESCADTLGYLMYGNIEDILREEGAIK